jgi:hypothetical protein
MTHTNSVGFLRTRDQPVAGTYTGQHTTFTRDRHSRRLKPSNPVAPKAPPRPRGHWSQEAPVIKTPDLALRGAGFNFSVILSKLLKVLPHFIEKFFFYDVPFY